MQIEMYQMECMLIELYQESMAKDKYSNESIGRYTTSCLISNLYPGLQLPVDTCSQTVGFSNHGLPRRPQFSPAQSLWVWAVSMAWPIRITGICSI